MLCSFWFAFPDHCVNLKLYICSEGIDWKVSFLDSSFKMLVLRRRTEVFLNTSILKIVFLWVLIAWFLPSRSQSEFHNFWQTFRLKSCRLFSLQQKPDGRKNPKGAMFFYLTRCSNSVFSEATGSISWIKTPSDFFGTVTNQSNKKESIMFLASESWLFQCSKNWIWWWLNLIFKLDILCSYRVRFSHHQASQKLYSFRGEFD